MKIFILLGLSLSLSAMANTIDFKSHFFVNGKKADHMSHVKVKSNAPTLIEVYFTDPRTGEIYKDFKIMHGKYMHMAIANKELSVFKHVHPYFDPITGRFAITVNMPYSDPDNQDAVKTFKKPGMYMIMADVIVSGVGMRMGHSMLMVKGFKFPTRLKLDPQTNNSITKFFHHANESTPMYKAIFSKNTINGCSGNIVNFEIEMFHYIDGKYQPLLDFEPWLSEAAHSVWISKGYMKHMHHNMPFAHMHSPFFMDDDDDETNDRVFDHILKFNFHDQKRMLPGTQKMWIQFKHLGKVMKIPFTFNYEETPVRDC